MMTNRLRLGVIFALALSAAVVQARQTGGIVPADLVGVWSGTWDGGGGSGGFELTLEKGKDGPDAGRVSVTGDTPYQATFRDLKFDAKKMMAVYDFPPEGQIEIHLDVTFEAGAAKGSWSARAKANGSEVLVGTLDLKHKK
jgi:hypothetical protein